METVLLALAALVAGAAVAVLLLWGRAGRLSDEQFAQLAERVRTEVAEAQSQALQRNSEQFLDLAETRLKQDASPSWVPDPEHPTWGPEWAKWSQEAADLL